jgi:hypothetical protein
MQTLGFHNSVNHSQANIKISEIVDKHQISYLKPNKSESEWGSNVQRENRDENSIKIRHI